MAADFPMGNTEYSSGPALSRLALVLTPRNDLVSCAVMVLESILVSDRKSPQSKCLMLVPKASNVSAALGIHISIFDA